MHFLEFFGYHGHRPRTIVRFGKTFHHQKEDEYVHLHTGDVLSPFLLTRMVQGLEEHECVPSSDWNDRTGTPLDVVPDLEEVPAAFQPGGGSSGGAGAGGSWEEPATTEPQLVDLEGRLSSEATSLAPAETLPSEVTETDSSTPQSDSAADTCAPSD